MAQAPTSRTASPDPEAVTVSAEPGKGFTVKAGDAFSAALRARFQLRDTFVHTGEDDTNEVSLRTLRFSLGGNVLDPKLRYNVQLAFGQNDFEQGVSSPLLDAYLDYGGLRDLNIRAGQFFVPFDRGRTVRESALQFVDRAQVIRDLSLDRDVGIDFYSEDLFGLGNRLGYHLFVGSGDGRNRVGGQTLGPLVGARLVVRPWGKFDDDQEGDLARSPSPKLAIGIAGAYNPDTDRQNSTYGATLTLGRVNYLHAAADVTFRYAGLSVFGEALYRHANRDQFVSPEDATVSEWSRSGFGYLVQAGYLAVPTFEVVGRWEQEFAETGTDPKFVKQVDSRGNQVGGGFNVYLNGHALKVQADYFYAFRGGASDAVQTARLALDGSF